MILTPMSESGGIVSTGYYEGGIENIGIFEPNQATPAMAGSEVVQEADMDSYFDAQLSTTATLFRSMLAALFRFDPRPFFFGWEHERYISNPS